MRYVVSRFVHAPLREEPRSLSHLLHLLLLTFLIGLGAGRRLLLLRFLIGLAGRLLLLLLLGFVGAALALDVRLLRTVLNCETNE